MKRAVTAAILLGSIAASNSQASVTVSPYRPEVGGRYVYFMVADTEAELDATAPPAGAFGWALDTSTLRCYTGSAWQDCATGSGGDGVGYDEIQDEATPLTKRAKVNFTGSGVSCADNAGSTRTDCTFTGGGVTDHGALTGLTDDDHTQYALLAGRSGGQSISGGTAAADNLNLYSSTADGGAAIVLDGNATTPTVTLKAGYFDSGGSLSNSYLLLQTNDIETHLDESNGDAEWYGTGGAKVANLDRDGVLGVRRICVDANGAAATQPCISEDGSGRLFHDTDGDGTKDTGEEYIDQAGGGGSVDVTDGTTTVSPATTLSFDPTYFDVTDGGSGEAGITFIGSAGGGNIYVGTTSLLNEPATPNAQDCEFDGNACDWTWQSATWTESAVEPNLQRGASEFYYDFDTWPGWVLMQGDNTSATQKYLSRSWSADTDATWMIHLLGSNFGAATNERRLQFCLENSGDSNEAVCIGYTTVATSGYWELFVNNNGSITSCKWTTNQTGTVYSNLADVVTVLWKDSDEYSGVQMDPDGGGLGGARICNVTK
ncbi:MAG: hypothetical protein KDB94_06135, partial [Acidobacteria bacterium]|nr:hypothetical protein [Acidobacteriota bacterium]